MSPRRYGPHTEPRAMNLLPGLSNLADKVPEIGTPRGFGQAVLMSAGSAAVAYFMLDFLDTRQPFVALALQVTVYVVLYALMRDFLGARMAYAQAFYNRYLPAVGLNLATIAYVLNNRGAMPDMQYVRLVPVGVALIPVLYLVITGLGLLFTVLRREGVDTMAGLYMYHPEEGRRLESGLYSVVRHPAYAGLARLTLGLGLLNGSAYALLLATLFVFAWQPVWQALEERELVRRFGDDYVAYRDRVPRILPASPEGELELLRSIVRAPQAGPATA